jgi:hypothetical protein
MVVSMTVIASYNMKLLRSKLGAGSSNAPGRSKGDSNQNQQADRISSGRSPADPPSASTSAPAMPTAALLPPTTWEASELQGLDAAAEFGADPPRQYEVPFSKYNPTPGAAARWLGGP